VAGVLRDDFAVRALAASEASMIEAPIRVCVTEGPDRAVLPRKLPSAVVAPDAAEGGAEVADLGAALDAIFAAIGAAATRQGQERGRYWAAARLILSKSSP
jgi:hypothetical protein